MTCVTDFMLCSALGRHLFPVSSEQTYQCEVFPRLGEVFVCSFWRSSLVSRRSALVGTNHQRALRHVFPLILLPFVCRDGSFILPGADFSTRCVWISGRSCGQRG